jgi:protein phosphatase
MNRAERLSSRYNPYLWVVGESLEALPVGELVHRRYRIVAPRIWLDTQPEQRPEVPDSLPQQAMPYLQAHDYRLHLPGIYGILERSGDAPILLLDNAPIHPQAEELFPAIQAGLAEASPLRQMNWLWQIWELWQNLAEFGVVSSLLDPNNIRVEGWRVRLVELHPDLDEPTIQNFGGLVRSLLSSMHESLTAPLSTLLDQVKAGEIDPTRLSLELNQLLLKQGAQISPRFALAGATAIGPTQPRNEDSCWPCGAPSAKESTSDIQIGIVCDGVGGHDGGEIASQLAVQSLKIQLQTLLAEAESESQALPPQVVMQQIEAVIRIVNELINHQNDNQARVGRQRMGTTLVMAVVIPQHVQTEEGWSRVHEVYLAHVGDSRAYWITPDYCHLLTVDDDISRREVQAGRQVLAQAQERSDAGALTQALGTRSGDHLHPHLQRFILDETGILLLCSDGLSDNYRIEDAWANYIGLIVKDIVTLESAVASWIELANQKNGHDNTAVVLIQHKLPPRTVPSSVEEAAASAARRGRVSPTDAKLYGEPSSEEATAPATSAGRGGVPLWGLIIAAVVVLGGLASWWFFMRPVAPPEPPTDTPAETQP